jgi:hypothetical protein
VLLPAFVLAASLGVSAFLPAQTARPATGPLAPFGVSEASVRAELLQCVSGGGAVSNNFLAIVQQGYERVPVPMRAAATTAAFAWAKSYVTSPAFTTAYAKYRDEHKPKGATSTLSIDEEVQKRIAEIVAAYELAKKGLDGLEPATRAKALKNIDDEIARYKSPEMVRPMRMAVAMERTGANAENAKADTDFAADWPADPKVFVRRRLEYFMTATANIDYSLPQIWVRNPGRTVGFLSPGLEDLPWETMRAIMIGKEAVDAARAAVAAWMKEQP